jgi:hypothetical protein
MLEAFTLTGQYKPEGRAAETIYTTLYEAGIVDVSERPTLFGLKVKDYLINERRKDLDAQEKSSRAD